MLSFGGGGNAALPPLPQCGACAGLPLNGTFSGRGSYKVGPATIEWDASATFDQNSSTCTWDNVPLHDPFHLQPKVHCEGVPFTLDRQRCNITSEDACTRAGEQSVESIQSLWDGADVITKTIVTNAPVVGRKRISWEMKRRK